MSIGGYFMKWISPPSIQTEIIAIFKAAEANAYNTNGETVKTAVNAAFKTAQEKGINAHVWSTQVMSAAKTHWGESDFERYMKGEVIGGVIKKSPYGQLVSGIVQFVKIAGASLNFLLPVLAIGALAWGASRVNNEQA